MIHEKKNFFFFCRKINTIGLVEKKNVGSRCFLSFRVKKRDREKGCSQRKKIGYKREVPIVNIPFLSFLLLS